LDHFRGGSEHAILHKASTHIINRYLGRHKIFIKSGKSVFSPRTEYARIRVFRAIKKEQGGLGISNKTANE